MNEMNDFEREIFEAEKDFEKAFSRLSALRNGYDEPIISPIEGERFKKKWFDFLIRMDKAYREGKLL